MRDFSVLIGGKAGEGLNKAGQIIAHLLGSLGYNIYMYYDYPSLIRGGHNFSIIRASDTKIASHRENVDVILALNQDTVDLHKNKVRQGGTIIYDSNYVKDLITNGIGIPLLTIIKEEKAPR
jgi:2-oxoglutarate ferredoxin oxidoreductase subunit alpha